MFKEAVCALTAAGKKKSSHALIFGMYTRACILVEYVRAFTFHIRALALAMLFVVVGLRRVAPCMRWTFTLAPLVVVVGLRRVARCMRRTLARASSLVVVGLRRVT